MTDGLPSTRAAAYSSVPAVVMELLDRGANIEARTADGNVPLHYAALNESTTDNIAVLLDRGADIAAADDDGWTTLHFAAAPHQRAGGHHRVAGPGRKSRGKNQCR